MVIVKGMYTRVCFKEHIISRIDNYGVITYGHKVECVRGGVYNPWAPVKVVGIQQEDMTEWLDSL